MANPAQSSTSIPQHSFGLPAFALALVGALTLVAKQPAQAQTYTVLHTFTRGADGAYPDAGLTMDGVGTFYGTASAGGNTGGQCGTEGCGTVFRLTQHGSGWIFSPLYSFTGTDHNDGVSPYAPVTVGPDGALYGTTNEGGSGYGTVFRLTPPASLCKGFSCPWTETVLHRFAGGSDGAYPGYGGLVFDQAGNIYGTTQNGGGPANVGTVFELTPSNGGWVETILYSFSGGGQPLSGVIFDSAGHLYGTAAGGGVVYELSPSGSGWLYQPLAAVNTPTGGVVFDSSGNLYGTTLNGGGSVYQLRPSNGSWLLSTLYNFNAYEGPLDAPTLDTAGNVYGTVADLVSGGIVFKLTRSNGWLESTVTDFGGFGQPVGSVIFDANGNMYGTVELGGSSGYGAVFEVTP
jgi:uncharacterized repeat protein (TIGR03803 family)